MRKGANLKICLAMFMFVPVLISTVAGGVIFVDADASGANNGSSWADAYNYLQDALADASSGDQIWVAQGIYKPDHGGGNTPGSRTATFRLKNGVTIKGGYAGAGTPNPNARNIAAYETILSGDLADNDVPNFVNYGDNSYHVVTGSGTSSTAVLDAFTITGGNADAYQSNSGLNNTILIPPIPFDPKKWGGGMYNDRGSPTINNCTFSSNASRYGGAAVYNKAGSSPTLTNCTFNGNHAKGNGGGICNAGSCNPTLTDCTFRRNSASSGGSMYNESVSKPTLTNCLFIENSAGWRAGGIYSYHSNPTLTDCTFYANSAGNGGAMAHSSLCSTVLTGCTFSGNSASKDGGAIYSTNSNTLTLTRCTLTGNSAGELGGAMYNGSGGATLTNCRLSENSSAWGGGMYNDAHNNSTLANCTITNNRADKDGGGICLHGATTTVTNCIFWDDIADEGHEMALFTRKFCYPEGCTFRPSLVTVSYSDVQGRAEGIYIDPNSTINWWSGNIDADPRFVHSGYQEPNGVSIEGDYNLLPGSPCVNAGDPDYIPQPHEKDLDGNPRIVNGRIDMGAYERPYLGFLVSPKSITVPEGATATFTVMLSMVPLGTLEATVYRESGDPDISVESGALLTFDSSNYSKPQTVTLTAAEDEDRINSEASIWIRASGFVVAVVSATEADNDPYPKTLHVDVDAPGANDGSSWADAYNDLQDALAVALHYDEIRVAQGIYTPEGPLKKQASNPNPLNGAYPVSITADLNWTAGVYATSHDVYFGTSSPGIFQGNQSSTTFDPGTMAMGTKYYWRVDEVGRHGTTTGAIWSFTTIIAPPTMASNESQDTTVTALDRTATFQLKSGVTIKGGYAGFGESDPNARDFELYETILSGDLADNDEPNFVNYDENSYHIVTGNGTDETAILDGFVITGGNANSLDPHDQGGGMFNERGNPTLANCTFSGNLADYSGGGMYNSWSSPRLVNCTFISNSAKKGGGMYKHYGSPVLSYCMFTKNWAMSGGGIGNRGSTLMVANCTFSENFATSNGGGMSNDQAGSELSNCTFIGNLASLKGGGLSNWHSNSVLTNCILSGNSGGEKGGGMYTFGSMGYKLANCVLVGNTAGEEGGGIWNEYTRPTMTNCTFATNSAPKGNALACDSSLHPSSIQVTNCILWDGGNEIWNNDDSAIKINYSDVEGAWPGEGNIDEDPYFVSAGYWDANGLWVEGDYHLLAGSPCIDAGDPCYVPEPNETDLDGRPRVIGGRIDMGAYEFFNTRPVGDAGDDQVVECACNTAEGTKVTLDGSESHDVDGDALTYSWTGPFIESPADGASPTVTLEDGCPDDYVITLVVNDGTEDSEPSEVKITVVDTTPPEFTLAVSPTVLWPPNKKMVKITPSLTLSDNCDATPDVSLVSVSMNESETRSNGHTGEDIQIDDDGTIYVRAKRNRTNDRIYTITYRAVDDYGNETEKSATVTVRRKKR